MASASQINANRENAKKSSGPTSEAGKQTSSHNALKHGLASNGDFYLLESEDKEKFEALCQTFSKLEQPQDEIERILVRRLAEHQWLITRAMRFQNHCFLETCHVIATAALSVYLRYQAQHERSFYKALKELRTIRELRLKRQIGFESQKQQAHAHNLRQLILIEKLRIIKSKAKPKETPSPAPIPQETSPGDPPNAA
jgi:hypothetical protein